MNEEEKIAELSHELMHDRKIELQRMMMQSVPTRKRFLDRLRDFIESNSGDNPKPKPNEDCDDNANGC